MKATIFLILRTSILLLLLDFLLLAFIMKANAKTIQDNNDLTTPVSDVQDNNELPTFASDVASTPVTKEPLGPIKIRKHPSTYFQPTKPIYTSFSYVGVQIELPIGNILEEAEAAVNYVQSMSYFQPDIKPTRHATIKPKTGNSTEEDVKYHPNYTWTLGMNRMIENKVLQIKAEIARTKKNVLAHVIPTVNLAETMANQHRRVTREFNVNLDLNASLQTFFSGISNFFHYKSLQVLTQSVANIQLRQTHLTDFTVKFAKRVQTLFNVMERHEADTRFTMAALFTAFMVLDQAQQDLQAVIAAMTPLLQGQIPSICADEANLVDIFHNINATAATKGLRIGLSNPNEILHLTPTTYQRRQSWEMLLSIPLIDHEEKFSAFSFINLPSVAAGNPTVWDLPPLTFGYQATLYPKFAKYLVIPHSDYKEQCQDFVLMSLCHAPIQTQPSCVANLFHNSSASCQPKKLSYAPILQRVSQETYFFFAEEEKVLIECPGYHAKITLHGLVHIEDQYGCKIVTGQFHYVFIGNSPTNIYTQESSVIVQEKLMPNISDVMIENPWNISFEQAINNLTDAMNEEAPPVSWWENPEAAIAFGVSALGVSLAMTLVCMFCAYYKKQ